MSAPPGFSANDSLLPDPGANSAPIHVMRGGGLKGGANIKRAFGMFPGGPLERVPPHIQDAFVREVEAFKEPGAEKSMEYIKQVFRVLKPQQKVYLTNLIKVYKEVAKKKQEQLDQLAFAQTNENTEKMIREGQYLVEATTGKVPNVNQPLGQVSTIEENPADFSVGLVPGKPSSVRYNATRNFPYSTNAVVGTRKLRISGKTPYYTTKRYGVEMSAVPLKKPGFFSRFKSLFSRKKGGRRLRRNQKRTLKRRN